MEYIQVDIELPEEANEIIIAELADAGFDSFEEQTGCLSAYIEKDVFDEEVLRELQGKYADLFAINYSFQELENKNWNEIWESNFHPIIVADKCLVRASFHPLDKSYPYEIVIDPKMAFGTGHHETTSLMIEALMGLDIQGKTVLDIGSGTGILAIFCRKYGATSAIATDVDDWCIENAHTNAAINHCSDIKLLQGPILSLKGQLGKYDIVIANINRNVILDEIAHYAACLNAGGAMLLSGFYSEDVPILETAIGTHGLKIQSRNSKNNWTMLQLVWE
ncbi:MAG: 50S ribosomal protein L11 methyltransferase, partial [Cytophagales bacterium]|nr:50S ribosomal protein L11 methyltransferase [Cytophagales bacterium]